MTYRIMVTGSRTWTDYAQIRDALRVAFLEGCMATPGEAHPILVHGAATSGADKIAHDVWLANVGIESIERHPAEWSRYGKRAGMLRNIEMVNTRPDRVLAFLAYCIDPSCHAFGRVPHYTHGANHCMTYARVQGLDVREFYQ